MYCWMEESTLYFLLLCAFASLCEISLPVPRSHPKSHAACYGGFGY
jgi:hypothetical protein